MPAADCHGDVLSLYKSRVLEFVCVCVFVCDRCVIDVFFCVSVFHLSSQEVAYSVTQPVLECVMCKKFISVPGVT